MKKRFFKGILQNILPRIFDFKKNALIFRIIRASPMMDDRSEQLGSCSDEQVFKELYERYAFNLFQFAYAFLKSKELAEEAVNDVFVALWKKRGQLAGIENLYAYLCRAVKNTALDYLDSNKRSATDPLDSLQAGHISFGMDPEHILINNELNQLIKKAVLELPPRCRLVFKLVKEDGLKYKDAAALLGISIRTVETQLAVALKKIGSVLLPHLPEQNALQKAKKDRE